MSASFKNYIRLKSEYNDIFSKIFEKYYDMGYFGNVSKSSIQKIQYEWFCKVINILENKQTDLLIPYASDHNNKITRAYVSRLTGRSLKAASEEDVVNILGELKDENI